MLGTLHPLLVLLTLRTALLLGCCLTGFKLFSQRMQPTAAQKQACLFSDEAAGLMQPETCWARLDHSCGLLRTASQQSA